MSSFETDRQTMTDLDLLGKYRSNSVISQYAGTVTRAGEHLLEEMFLHPLSDRKAINGRTEIFRYFRDHQLAFPLEAEEYDLMEQYLDGGISSWAGLVNSTHLLKVWLLSIAANDPEYALIRNRAVRTLVCIGKTIPFLEQVETGASGELAVRCRKALDIAREPRLVRFMEDMAGSDPTFMQLLAIDRYLRGTYNAPLRELLDILEHLDVDVVVGKVARNHGFCFAEAVTEGRTLVSVKGLFHPGLKGAIANDIELTDDSNVLFLTGANMAGKSTLMKSLGIAVYLAHMGFPVAAEKMVFCIQDGLYTSINVPDNIEQGYSHFYAEVLRVKHVALEISKDKHLVVIFDELFKGTNVKDAYDATLAVTEAISRRRHCTFVVSTHIIEVGEELARRCRNVSFRYLPTVMKGKVPVYTYRLEEGITRDKHGMVIINNERIIETIRGEI